MFAAAATSQMPLLGGIFGAIFAICGVILIVIGILYFILAVGLLGLKPWARKVAKGLAILSLILGILSLLGGSFTSVLNVLIAIIIIWYLGKPEIKAAFGEGLPPPMPPQQGYYPPPPPQ